MADDKIWFDTKYEPSRTNKIVKNFNFQSKLQTHLYKNIRPTPRPEYMENISKIAPKGLPNPSKTSLKCSLGTSWVPLGLPLEQQPQKQSHFDRSLEHFLLQEVLSVNANHQLLVILGEF